MNKNLEFVRQLNYDYFSGRKMGLNDEELDCLLAYYESLEALIYPLDSRFDLFKVEISRRTETFHHYKAERKI